MSDFRSTENLYFVFSVINTYFDNKNLYNEDIQAKYIKAKYELSTILGESNFCGHVEQGVIL